MIFVQIKGRNSVDYQNFEPNIVFKRYLTLNFQKIIVLKNFQGMTLSQRYVNIKDVHFPDFCNLGVGLDCEPLT